MKIKKYTEYLEYKHSMNENHATAYDDLWYPNNSTKNVEGNLRFLGITNPNYYKIYNDLSVDYFSDFEPSQDIKLSFKKFPVKMNICHGAFSLYDNKLTTLENFPHTVNFDFDIRRGFITSLEFGPKIVNKRYDCDENKLTNLIGAPEKMNNTFCCSRNYKLTSLEGAPKECTHFYCDHTVITDLKGCPNIITQQIDLQACDHLKTLSGLPLTFNPMKILLETNKNYLIDNWIDNNLQDNETLIIHYMDYLNSNGRSQELYDKYKYLIDFNYYTKTF